MKRIFLMLFLIAIGLPARSFQDVLPQWYTLYFGDYLWAMLVLQCYVLVFYKFKFYKVVLITLAFTYLIEISQLFHPPWLEALRDIKIIALVIGYGFLWTDLVAYTLGIFSGAYLERFITPKEQQN